jgi:integrase
VSASRKSWAYRYRNLEGKLKQVGLGQWPDMGAPEAIVKWNEQRLLRDSGVDPKAAKQQAKQEAIANLVVVEELKVRQVVEDYIKDHILVNRDKESAKSAERRLRAVLAEEPAFAEMPAKQVTRAVAFNVLDRRKDKPTAAAKIRGLMGGAWAHSLDAGRLDGGAFNWWPDLMKGKLKSKGKIIGGKHVGRSRRVLRDTEIGTLLGWMHNMHQLGQDCFVMYLWTATRGGEATEMRPEHLQREDGRVWWVIPKGATKNTNVDDAVDLRVPLFGRALEVVERRLKEVGPSGWLFADRCGEQYTQHDFSTYIYSLQSYSAKAASRGSPGCSPILLQRRPSRG